MLVVNLSAEELLGLGERLLDERRLPEALDRFREAEAAGGDPDRCAAGRWMVFMLTGDFEAAWQESDGIRRRGKADPNRLWNGEALDERRVIVRCLHGFGDAVQFLRYARPLRERASRVIVEVPPRFTELAQGFDGIDEVITWGAGAPSEQPEWDVQVEVMELPYIFRSWLDDLPGATQYLKLNSPTRKTGARGHLRVGVNTSVGEWNRERGIQFRSLEPLFTLPGIEFCDLRPHEDIAADDPEVYPGRWGKETGCQHSLYALAETIAELDLVVTVDTLAAHLAGALGVTCWVLLQHQADWRWMHAREDSPWYPTLRLFRQPRPGDWQAVIDRVRNELSAERVNTRHIGSLVGAG